MPPRLSDNPCEHCGFADYAHLARHRNNRPAYCVIAEKDNQISQLKKTVDDKDYEITALKDELKETRIRLEIMSDE